MSADLEGRIDIILRRGVAGPAGVEIRSSRPQLAQRLMAGRTPEEAAELAGLIFSLCGKAQRVAAQAACAAARDETADETTMEEREARVLAELAQEHAWRLLLNWPEQAGLEPDMPGLLALRRGPADPADFAGVLETLLEEHFLGEPPEAWLERDLAGFDDWCFQGGTLPASLFAGLGRGADIGSCSLDLLPSLEYLEEAAFAELAGSAMDDADFCARPLRHGRPAETGALARNLEQPLLAEWIAERGRGSGARLLARLLELARLPRRLRGGGFPVVRARPLGDNTGVAAVETSRGLLIHVVRLENYRVGDYRIVAPTEWNFHSAGALAQSLMGLAPGDDLLDRARLVAQSLDPCVAYGVEVL